MKDNKLISVVVPTFNRQDTISHCLNSVLDQTYKNLEVVVVDDCSKDGTVSIVCNHPDPRVRCIVLDQHTGAQGARNRGIHEARADWIAFQDSDDEWLPSKLEKQASVLADADYDPWIFVYCNAYRFDKEKGVRSIRLLPVVEGYNQYPILLQTPAPIYPSMVTSKKALEKIGYLDEQVPSFQEWDTSIRLAKHCRIVHLKEPLMVYYTGSNEAISASATKHVEGLHYIISKYKRDIQGLCGQEAWVKLNVQLLGSCLDSGLVKHFDLYRNEFVIQGERRIIMYYLMICRKYGFRPSNIVYRVFRRLFRISGHFGTDQGAIVKQ